MMKKIYKLSILLLIFVGCQSKSNIEKIKKIDSLIIVTEDLNKNILGVNIDSVNIVLSETSVILENLSKADSKYSTKQNLNTISAISNVNRTCKKFIGKYSVFQKELSFSEHQLINLKHDVENNKIADSLFQAYYKQENFVLGKLNADINRSVEWLNNELVVYKNIRKTEFSLNIINTAVPANK